MNFFSLLREHARTRTETVAVSSPRRSMTYRKLWSRIERATARLQYEWGVGRGDTVVYCGDSHPDALVLFFALARCGAKLLPLHPSLYYSEPSFLARTSRLSLLIRDDELPLTGDGSFASIKPLSSLIATPCPHEPTDLSEDAERPVLLCRSAEGLMAPPHAYSLQQLWSPQAAILPTAEVKITRLFDPGILSQRVLPGLHQGACLMLP